MLTAKWTAIGRRLAVRGRSDRPPASLGQVRHRQIVAPLAATALAGAAVVAGVAASRAGRARRRPDDEPVGPRRREARTAPAPAPRKPPPPGAALQCLMLSQTDAVIARLSATAGAPDAKTVHSVRKDLKRLRAELLLIEDHLGRKRTRREERVLAGVAGALAQARDAEVMLATLDALIARHPKRLGHRRGVQRVRRRLVKARAGAHSQLEDPLVRAELLGELLGLRERLAAWDLAACPAGQIEAAYTRLYRDGRRRWHRAERGRRGARSMHAWRRQVKSLRYTTEALAACAPDGEPKRLAKIAARADSLGEVLGDEHDLVVITEWVEGLPRKGGRKQRVGGRTRRELRRHARRRRRELRFRALREGERLYGKPPGKAAAAARASLSRR